jgi:hypothetical protein
MQLVWCYVWHPHGTSSRFPRAFNYNASSSSSSSSSSSHAGTSDWKTNDQGFGEALTIPRRSVHVVVGGKSLSWNSTCSHGQAKRSIETRSKIEKKGSSGGDLQQGCKPVKVLATFTHHVHIFFSQALPSSIFLTVRSSFAANPAPPSATSTRIVPAN